MNSRRFLRVLYLLPIFALLYWPVPVGCEQCGGTMFVESVACRIASHWEDNFLCSWDCIEQWLEENPIERDSDGEVIPRW